MTTFRSLITAAAMVPAAFLLALHWHSEASAQVVSPDIGSTIHPDAILRALPFFLSNPSFERGYSGWRSEGDAFSTAPNQGRGIPARRALQNMHLELGGIGGDYWQDLIYPIGVKGEFWASSGERAANDPALPRRELRGSLISHEFYLSKRYVSFLIAGRASLPAPTIPGASKDTDGSGGVPMPLVRVELRSREQSGLGITRTLAVSTPYNEDSFRREIWDLEQFGITPEQLAGGLRVHIAVIDQGTYEYVSVDDFRFSDEPPELLPGLARDVDHPVWGVADTHAHPTNQHGFGGRTIRGDTDGPIASALSTAQCTSTHSGLLRVMGGRNHQSVAIAVLDEHIAEGYPTFVGWPRFTSKTHQQMFVDWMRRAHQGGVNLIVALGVTNMFWATRALGPGIEPDAPVDDETAALMQVAEMQRIARANPNWMEVALTPRDARRIILQGKLALVLGVELDNFGNFKRADYAWRDRYAMPPSNPLVSLPEDADAAKRALADKIAEYRRLGIRQVTPLHYISGVFGGTAVFRWQFSMIQTTVTGRPYRVRDGAADGIYFHVSDDASVLQAVFGNLGEASERGGFSPYATCADPACGPLTSTVNADGLTPAGRRLMHELMRSGMLIDVEHASIRSAEELFSAAREFEYPLLSSHTDPAALAFRPTTSGTRFAGSDDDKLSRFGTTLHNNLAHEGMLSETNFARIRDSGGTAGVLLFPSRRKHFAHPSNAVANDCDGSSKSFAQMYLHSVDRMGGRGVAIASDRGFNEFIAPRFGVGAAHSIRAEHHPFLKERLRLEQRHAQQRTPGVRYDQPLRDWHPSRYEFGDVSGEEEDAWKALAWFQAMSLDPDSADYAALAADRKVPSSNDALHAGRILQYVRGLAKTAEDQLEPGNAEQAAMFCARRGITPEELRTFSGTDINTRIRPLYNTVVQVHRLWLAMTTSTRNAPLRRLTTGQRAWDFNIDGLAHYGLLPDFFQDLRNVGVSSTQLQPLFNSAEDYIRMWERADAATARVPDR